MMSLQDLENAAIGMLSNMPDRTSQLVRVVLKTVLPLYPQLAVSMTEAQLEETAKLIETKLSISMRDASAIQTDFDPWLPGRRGEVRPLSQQVLEHARIWLCGFGRARQRHR
jgi:hypothetical protein